MITRRVRKLWQECRGREAHLFFLRHRLETTRFARSTIHQNMAEENVEATIVVKKGRGVGRAVVHSLALADLKRALKSAIESLSSLPLSRVPSFAKKGKVRPLLAFDESVQRLTLRQKALQLKRLFKKGARQGISFSGAYISGSMEIGVFNSYGQALLHPMTVIQLNCVAERDEHAGFAGAHSWRRKSVRGTEVFAEAERKVAFKQPPKAIPAGKYTVILEPQAVVDLLSWLTFIAFSGKAIGEGMSFLTRREAQRVVAKELTLVDDGQDVAGFPLPFDFEGRQRERVVLIDEGRAGSAVYDSIWAKRLGMKPTGHALPSDTSDTMPMPLNLFWQQGDLSMEELIKSTERGLLITRFHYLNGFLNPPQTILTGMTRHGTFLIKKGKIAHPVQNLRFTESFLHAFSKIEGMTRERKLVPLSDWNLLGTCLAPAVKLSSFTFTDRTKF